MTRTTSPGDALSEKEARRFRDLRRVGIAFLAAIVLLAATGLLGQKTTTAKATGGGYTLSVTYPSVVHPGVDVRFEIVVSNPNGFGKSLSIALDHHYFDLFDLNSLRPDPDSSSSNGTVRTGASRGPGMRSSMVTISTRRWRESPADRRTRARQAPRPGPR